MQLEKEHRQALLNELEKSREKRITAKNLLNDKDTEDSLKKHFEINDFLLSKQIELIETSLIENEIDY